MPWLVTVAVLGASGCSLFLGGDDGSPAGDGGLDGGGDDGSDGELVDPFGTLEPFDPASLAGRWDVGAPCFLDTSGAITDSCGAMAAIEVHDGVEIAVVRAADVVIAADLGLAGDRAFAIIARQVTVDEGVLIDAGSHVGEPSGGPGHRDCSPNVDASGDAGGAGGSHAGLGGNGGQAASGTPGVSSQVGDDPGALVGGCRGGNGDGDNDDPIGGRGGGVVHIVAVGSISFEGDISAGGAGGEGGAMGTNNGGAGGGAGGMIVIESPATAINGTLAAFGGGGGAGATVIAGGVRDGVDATVDGPGAGGTNGVDGGDGGGPVGPNGAPGLGTSGNDNGAGGGGGGAGIVLVDPDPG